MTDNHHVTAIKPSGRWRLSDMTEILAARELLWMLTLRDIRVRYKQTVLGIGWAVLQPVFGMVVFTIVLHRAAGLSSPKGIPYPIYVYSGLAVWLYFADATTRASMTIVTNRALVTKVYFPRLIAPLSGVFAPLLDFAFALLVLFALMLFYGTAVGWSLLALPLFIVAAVFTAMAFGVLLAALNVQYRDIMYAVPLAVQLGLFLTPVVYDPSHLDGLIKWIYSLNPMAGVVMGFRWSILHRATLDWSVVLISQLTMLSILVLGIVYFRRVERTFADAV